MMINLTPPKKNINLLLRAVIIKITIIIMFVCSQETLLNYDQPLPDLTKNNHRPCVDPWINFLAVSLYLRRCLPSCFFFFFFVFFLSSPRPFFPSLQRKERFIHSLALVIRRLSN